MKKNFKKICALALVGVLSVTALAGCKKEKTSGEVQIGEEKYSSSYPIDSNGDRLSMWIINSVHSEYSSYAEMPFWKEAEKLTGIPVDVQGPTGGQFEESFNLMIASGELPDIIMYDWAEKKVPGGPAKYIAEKYIIPLNEVIDAYAPNLKKILAENPDIDKAVKTDDGQYYVFPNIDLEKPVTYCGPIFRQDWLDDLGLEVPETIDEWHTVLTEFKNKKNASSPLLYTHSNFETNGFLTGAYNTNMTYYINENGKIEYGPATQKWKEFLITANQWYEEGLLDKDIATLDTTTKNAKIVSGRCGAFFGSGGDLGMYIPQMAEVDPKAKFVAAKYPVLNKGDVPEFGICDNKYSGLMSSAITADCENVELAAKFLDYFFSADGRMFANFGVEGVTYNMVDGYPKLSDMVLNSGNIHNEMSKYMNQQFTVSDPRYYDQRMVYPEQKNAINTWGETKAENHKLPVLLPTQEETDELAKYTSEIDTYANEMYIKFMIGTEDISGFDAYLEKLNTLGMGRVLEIYENIYSRYQNR